MKVSIILPTYNECGNIVSLITEIMRNVPKTWDYVIIVVDDASPDQTYTLAKDKFNENWKVIAVLRTSDKGLAKSIRTGLELATGSKVVVMDTYFTHDPIEIAKMIDFSKYYDIVSASRFCSGGSMQSVRHYLASYFYNLLVRLILRTQIQDNLGGILLLTKRN